MDIKIKLNQRTRGFFETFELYPVTNEWEEELYNYFIRGWEPGSFHSALLANNLCDAVYKSHPLNEWEDIQAFVKWTFANAPSRSIGSYENVQSWLEMEPEKRKQICVDRKWVLTDEALAWKLLEEA